MKNHWLNNKLSPSIALLHYLNVPLCVKIICSKDEVPGGCIWDLHNCETLDDCLQEAIRRSEELTVIGPADKIVLMTISKDELFSIPGLENGREAEQRNTICSWEKIYGRWWKRESEGGVDFVE